MGTGRHGCAVRLSPPRPVKIICFLFSEERCQKKIETVYDAIALDAVSEDRQNLLLAKLVLLLSNDLGDTELICKRIKEASANLVTEPSAG